MRRAPRVVHRRATLAATLAVALCTTPGAGQPARQPDVIIIGAGIAGLSAAVEAARGGAQVLVVDMSTVGGGHAILSNGAVSIVGTPLQASRGISDSRELAEKDFIARGEDNDRRWVEAYARDSREWLYDWLTDLGVTFQSLVRPPGNTVPRLHLAQGKGLGLVEPLYRAALAHRGIRFQWATAAEDLVVERGRVTGIRARDLRRGTRRTLAARNVIVATGGFQSNLRKVLGNWPSDLPRPPRVLAGAAHSATGQGHDLVRSAGGLVSRLDHQWNYVLGLPDPRDSTGVRGLAAFNLHAIWVNASGKRFTPELGDEKGGLRALLEQPGATYWSVFDENGKGGFSVTLAGWENAGEITRLVFDSPGLVLRADSLDALAASMRVPADQLKATVARFNELAAAGIDRDFGAFGEKTFPKPKAIGTPPFYAAQFFPLTRKSMGGVGVDTSCRVLDRSGSPIPGLYAVGEVTGFGGINGKAALEGTFLGPAIYMGRIAGRQVARGPARPAAMARAPTVEPAAAAATFENAACLTCHNAAADVGRKREGYWHYEQSHAKVLSRSYACSSCHASQFPYRTANHRFDPAAAVAYCRACHGVQPRDGQPLRALASGRTR